MDWFSIDMPQGSLTDGAYHRLCRAFQRAFIDAGAPSDLALFAARSGEAKRRLYLTPSSVRYVPDLIRRHDGHRCAAPEAPAVTLVYGVPGAVSLLPRDAQAQEEQRPSPNSIAPFLEESRRASTR